MSVTRRGLSFTLSIVLLLLLAESLVIAAGQVFLTDPIRSSFLPYAQFMPGQSRPETGCEEVWDQWHERYGDFVCVFHERDEINVYGNGDVITGTFIVLTDARAGDVLSLLDTPLPRPAWVTKRSRSRFFDWDSVQVYLYLPHNLFERMRYLSFWKPIPA